MQFSDDCEAIWTRLLDEYATTNAIETQEIPKARFSVKVEGWSGVWFEVEMSVGVAVKGEYLGRAEQERWQEIVRTNELEVSSTGAEFVSLFVFSRVRLLRFNWAVVLAFRYPVYELVSLRLLPLLHEEAEKPNAQLNPSNSNSNSNIRTSPRATTETEAADSKESKRIYWHALLTSHHLISPTKRRNLQQWSSSLSLSGFAKVGYPGVIYVEGERGGVEEFVEDVKGMQWLALRVRFVEALEGGEGGNGRRWREFEKVGEVVEEMRRLGREKYVVEMGIGSSKTR
ncbi:hypothetical protein AX17_007209 [Amanita inopinata Kibby_2008]|nr:hypothetical protein AX17_007209 [Amanita inopinata Kibby_2008]